MAVLDFGRNLVYKHVYGHEEEDSFCRGRVGAGCLDC
jgi:hypothetical protein